MGKYLSIARTTLRECTLKLHGNAVSMAQFGALHSLRRKLFRSFRGQSNACGLAENFCDVMFI